jgi:molybdenum cofactor biosynthesis protein B
MSIQGHRDAAVQAVGCAIVTVSDTRTVENDRSGQTIADALSGAGHTVLLRLVVRDEETSISAAVRQSLDNPDVSAVVTTGGTGISRRDSTPEAVLPILEKTLEGFGELFRSLSYAEIGTAAMLSRALAGTVGTKVVFILPGSEPAVRFAMDRLVVPELNHILGELRK